MQVAARSKAWVCSRSLDGIAGTNPAGGMDVYLLWVLSGRILRVGMITRPEGSYRVWCVVVCDLETSWMRRPWPTGGCCAKKKQYICRRQMALKSWVSDLKTVPESWLTTFTNHRTFQPLWHRLIFCCHARWRLMYRFQPVTRKTYLSPHPSSMVWLIDGYTELTAGDTFTSP